MRVTFVWVLILLTVLSLTGCGTLFGRNRSAKENAVQALVTTTRSCVLMMTAAGIAYDAGAFGQPGTPRAELTWSRIADQSVSMNKALTAWTDAIKENRDATAYSALVAQALAVIGALLPNRPVSALEPISDIRVIMSADLALPDSFRRFAFAGGSR